MSLAQRKPLPKTGPVKRRWASWQRSQHNVVVERAQGSCEGCGQTGRPLQVAHLMGRRNIVSEPWASWAGLCAHLCSADLRYGLGCHEKVDRYLDDQLRFALHDRAARALLPMVTDQKERVNCYRTLELKQAFYAIGQAVRSLEASGIDPLGRR